MTAPVPESPAAHGRYSAETIARVCHAANTELQRIAGDSAPSVPWDSETEETRATTIAGVIAVLNGASPEESHAEWCRNKAADGWRRGAVKDAEAKTHPCLVPYDQLPEAERVKDRVFGVIVRAMSQAEPGSSFTEWAVFYGGDHPDGCAGLNIYDDEAEAEEMLQWITGAGISKRIIAHGPWTVTREPGDAEETAAILADPEAMAAIAEGDTMASPVARYRPRRTEIEVVRWDGSPGVLAVLAEWGADPMVESGEGEVLRVWGNREGYAGAREGDWLVRDGLEGASAYRPEDFDAEFGPAGVPDRGAAVAAL